MLVAFGLIGAHLIQEQKVMKMQTCHRLHVDRDYVTCRAIL